jgi:iron complex outermembrane receptor protein
MRRRDERLQARLLCGAAAAALLMMATPAQAQQTTFNIAAQPLADGLNEFAKQSGRPVMFTPDVAAKVMTRGAMNVADPETALNLVLADTGLTWRRSGDTYLITKVAADPQGGSAAGGGAEVEGLIVTAQKREENIQDVPIAMSAFSQEDLENHQIAGGPDLITQIPNFSFTKTNFTGYSIQIRGIGTQAVSATTDPGVAVAFNNTPFVRNRFFEQEFYDLERVEVLRGPQGTLYGRNATAGVVNIISAKPKFTFESKLMADVANYNSTRLEGMINFPLVEDAVALRLAGAWTRRDGYATNQVTGAQIDGRELWSTRVSLRFEPTDWISANLVWEHFEEDDDRLRSSKQLCKKDRVTQIGNVPVPAGGSGSTQGVHAFISQGCTLTSLYSEEAFQTPYGFSLPYFGPLSDIGLPVFDSIDPYLSETQSRDLRVIESTVEPDYRAKTDLAELQISFDLTDTLTLVSETGYNADELFSLQDYNRFTTTSGVFNPNRNPGGGVFQAYEVIDENGVYCDPQLGCSDRLLLVDLSTSESTQFSQEFRLGSDFDGPFNFSLGVNYLRHDALDKYYVFINTVSLWADYTTGSGGSGGGPCRRGPFEGELAATGDPTDVFLVTCPYMDPNPIGSLNDVGRNYFLSKNPYKLISYAAFGEIYYNITPDLKLTGGLRLTVDKKRAPQIPSWLLAGPDDGPFPITHTVDQEWREPTGRLTLDWKPDLAFTDDTLVYASYAHGYKAGGANPPPPVMATYGNYASNGLEFIPDTFDPEFVDAFEVGTKNTLLDGALTLNLTGFYYDYKDYQVSEIRNRAAVNSNYDAQVWGVEIEADWRPTEYLKLGFKGGYNGTSIADGETSIDLMDRTAGNPDWKVWRSFPSVPSNCILPVYVLTVGNQIRRRGSSTPGASDNSDCIEAYYNGVDPVTLLPYTPNPTQWLNRFAGITGAIEPLPTVYAGYPGFDPLTAPNGGRGFSKDLSGNELPNAPDFTATVTADYTAPLRGEWLVNLHADVHWQSDSWWRVFNDTEYNRLDEFYVVNLAAIFTNEDAGWKVMAYVKNVLDEDALTGAFLNSDDSGLTTNVFLTEPRLYGVRISKDFTGSVFGWTGDGRTSGEPYPFEVEIGGGMSRFDRGTERYAPDWMTPVLAPSLDAQDYDLDWGDIRSLKLAYQLANGWNVSAAYMYGKTNGQSRHEVTQDIPGLNVPFGDDLKYVQQVDNYAVTSIHDSEEDTVADFKVGKDVGLGAFGADGTSTLAAGLRYASLQSEASIATGGIEGSYIAPDVTFSTGVRRHNAFKASLVSEREFTGTGPSVSWDASVRLLGDDQGGHADLDWSVGGAVLFGKQSAESGDVRSGVQYRATNGSIANIRDLSSYVVTPIYASDTPHARSEDVTVPSLSLSLGLSYSIDRLKVSTGYAYDRFFDAIDGGIEEAQTFDRTIHGPYLKLSLGFGG